MEDSQEMDLKKELIEAAEWCESCQINRGGKPSVVWFACGVKGKDQPQYFLIYTVDLEPDNQTNLQTHILFILRL